jgi:hypothetical protein
VMRWDNEGQSNCVVECDRHTDGLILHGVVVGALVDAILVILSQISIVSTCCKAEELEYLYKPQKNDLQGVI